MLISAGKIWPLSKGERYFRNLQKWYEAASVGDWEKAGKLEKNLKQEDLIYFKENNKSEELKKKLNELTLKDNKSSDDLAEMAVICYRLGKREDAITWIKEAKKMDPIREDISKIYFTFQSSQQL